MANTYTLIASATASGTTTTTVTFSSIPQTYTDLLFVVNARTNRAGNFDELLLRFNSDSATNYSAIHMSANAGTATSQLVSSNTSLRFASINGNTTTSNVFSNTEIYIPNYTGTANKPISTSTVVETNDTTNYYIRGIANLYRGSSAITSISCQSYFDPGVLYFIANSTFYLYGIS